MNLDLVDRIVDAVLYEGYILYPYRASAIKNRQRFNFGALLPRDYSEAQRGSDPWVMRTECLLKGESPVLDLRIRFLHLLSRQVKERVAAQASARQDAIENGPVERDVDSLCAEGRIFQTWEEASEREIVLDELSIEELTLCPRSCDFVFAGQERFEPICDGDRRVGTVVRKDETVAGAVEVSAARLGQDLFRISVAIRNTTPLPDASQCSREQALRFACASTHTILGARQGEFLSLADQRDPHREEAAQCQNEGTWPALVGRPGDRHVLLSSPIILEDYPQVAPESLGDFFDATEIDEMLMLRVMTLTDEEKVDMRAVDARARKILERTESLGTDDWMRMHGALRGLRPVISTPPSLHEESPGAPKGPSAIATPPASRLAAEQRTQE